MNVVKIMREKVDSDCRYLKQQMNLFASEYRDRVRTFNSSSEKVKKLKKSSKTQPDKLQHEFAKHEELAVSLLEFCKKHYKQASDEECRRYNFFHSKQHLILNEYIAMANCINSLNIETIEIGPAEADETLVKNHVMSRSSSTAVKPMMMDDISSSDQVSPEQTPMRYKVRVDPPHTTTPRVTRKSNESPQCMSNNNSEISDTHAWCLEIFLIESS